MIAARTPVTMGVHVETWSMTFTVTAKMDGKERLAIPVSVTARVPLSVFCVRGALQHRHSCSKVFFLQVTASVTRPHATMVVPAMMKGMHLSACVLVAGKEQPAT